VAGLVLVVALVEADRLEPGALVCGAWSVLVGGSCAGELSWPKCGECLLMRAFGVEAAPLFLMAMDIRLSERVGLLALAAFGGDARETGLWAAAGGFGVAEALRPQAAPRVRAVEGTRRQHRLGCCAAAKGGEIQ
jgi:hypothetical protein